jgi:aldose 1-epimerase
MPGGGTLGGAWPQAGLLDAVVTRDDARLAVDLRGGGLRELVDGDWHVLDGYPSGTLPHGRRGGVLFPWPNRLRDGRWRWEGADLQLDVTAPETPNAIHGLVSWQPFSVLATAGDAVTVGGLLEPRPGYPFRLALAIDYALAPGRLTTTFRVRNAGERAAPFGLGMHPYLRTGDRVDDAELTLPVRTALDLDAGLPAGGSRPFDGALGRIGDRLLDDALTDLVRDDDGWARVRVSGPAGRIELAVDGAWRWLQVYTGDTLPAGERRHSLAVEPMTCPPNALADGTDLVVLEPGGEWSGSFILSWTPAA